MTRRQKIVWSVVLGAPVLGYLAIAALNELAYQEFIAPKLEQMKASVEKHVPAALEDARFLDAHPLFGAWTREKNAEPYLTKYVKWASAPTDPEWKDRPRLLALDEKHKGGLTKTPETWNAFKSDPDLSSIDVSWVDGITEFDHWDLQTYATTKDILEKGPAKNSIARIGMLASAPIPESIEFRLALLVRFAQLEAKGETKRGFELLRHGAKLFHTSSTLIGSMMAVDLLSREIQLAEYTNSKDWNSFPAETLATYKRLAWGWGGIIQLSVWKPEVLQDFEPYLKPENGFCAGTMENVMTSGIWGEFLEEHAPLERDYRVETARVRETAGRLLDKCGLSAYRGMTSPIPPEARVWFSKEASKAWSMADDGFSIPVNPSQVPFARRSMGMLLMVIAVPNWMGQYDKRTPASN